MLAKDSYFHEAAPMQAIKSGVSHNYATIACFKRRLLFVPEATLISGL